MIQKHEFMKWNKRLKRCSRAAEEDLTRRSRIDKLGKDLLESRLLLQEGIVFWKRVLFAPSPEI